jgi:hypothetical protein
LESLLAKVEEPCVREWMAQLNPNTKNYAHHFLGFYDWFRANGSVLEQQPSFFQVLRCK